MEKLYRETRDLFDALLHLETVEEIELFLEDLCTIKELKDLSQRYQVAKMLHEKKNYQDISKETGASTATISRVNKCLVYGAGGYRIAIDRTEDNKNA